MVAKALLSKKRKIHQRDRPALFGLIAQNFCSLPRGVLAQSSAIGTKSHYFVAHRLFNGYPDDTLVLTNSWILYLYTKEKRIRRLASPKNRVRYYFLLVVVLFQVFVVFSSPPHLPLPAVSFHVSFRSCRPESRAFNGPHHLFWRPRGSIPTSLCGERWLCCLSLVVMPPLFARFAVHTSK